MGLELLAQDMERNPLPDPKPEFTNGLLEFESKAHLEAEYESQMLRAQMTIVDEDEYYAEVHKIAQYATYYIGKIEEREQIASGITLEVMEQRSRERKQL
jgi:hypothetical protein